jgi:putative ABC transport system permease protein
MISLREWLSRFRGTLLRRRRDADLEEELRVHLELAAEDEQRHDHSPAEAGRAAVLHAGGVAQAMDALRDQRGLPWMEDLGRDFAYSIRGLRRNPAFAGVAVLTLALTLGIGTALFTLVDVAVLTPPPFADPDTLILLGELPASVSAGPPRQVGWTTFEQWREYRQVVEQVEAVDAINMTFTGRGPAQRVGCMAVSPGYFSLLGITTMMGARWDEQQAGSDVAVVSERFWRSTLASDPSIIGGVVTLGGRPFIVVGVVPNRFSTGSGATDVWFPLRRPANPTEEGPQLRVLARLGRGVTGAQAAAILDEVSSRASPPSRAVVVPLTQSMRGAFGNIVRLLFLGAALAILLAVVNLASILVARAIGRHREFAIRRALGGSATQLARQLFVEAHVLIAIGAIGGVIVALAITPLVGRLVSDQFANVPFDNLTVNWRAMVALALAVWPCAWLCGLAVSTRALRAQGSDLVSRRTSAGPGEQALRRVLVAAEIALAFVLLVSLAVVGRSLQRTFAIDPGFDAEHVVTVGLSLPQVHYPDEQRIGAFYRALDGKLSMRFGRENVSVIDELPLTGDAGRSAVGQFQGDNDREAVVRSVGTSYFAVMRIPIVEGRGFDERDDRTSPARVVVSQSLARSLFGGAQASGRRVYVAALRDMADVIGVVGDVRHRALDEVPLATLYVSAWQQPSRTSRIVIRQSAPFATVVATLRAEIAQLDSELPVYGATMMADIVQNSPGIPTRRVMAACFVGFATLGIVIAGLGIFGVVTHDLVRRRFEFALRLALGANPAQLQRSVAARAGIMVAAGIVPGVILAIVVSRMLHSVIADIASIEPLALMAVAAVLSLAAAIAVAAPALGIARTDPALVLRSE